MFSGPYKFLIVDDEKDICELITKLTSMYPARNSLEVLSTDSPETALEILKKETVSILLTDLNMPKVHGFDLINEALKNHRSTQILAMTGAPQRTLGMSLYEDGVYLMLDKPPQAIRLYQALDLCIGKIRFWEEFFAVSL